VTTAIVHDYLTQRGGAERVVLSLTRAFPEAPIYTSLYDPDGTFPEFGSAVVRTLALDRIPPLRRHHRAAMPLLAAAFSRLRIGADVVVCSSSGWAHGAVAERKVIYCHTPARWLYQPERYLGSNGSLTARAALALQAPLLLRWDRRAAATAVRYVANSTAVRDRIRAAYRIDADVIPPPCTLDPEGPARPVPGLEAGFILCVSRLLPYKNVGTVVEAFADLPAERLVVAGAGPEAGRIRELPPNVRVLGRVPDEELRWLYASCRAVASASYEDYGLTPVEAAAFAKPSAVLRFGGFLDTVVEGLNGVFFEGAAAADVRDAVRRVLATAWDGDAIRRHAEQFSEARFVERMRAVVEEEAA
jgi:glycosyltransferase involved in cell wall biosynthesis